MSSRTIGYIFSRLLGNRPIVLADSSGETSPTAQDPALLRAMTQYFAETSPGTTCPCCLARYFLYRKRTNEGECWMSARETALNVIAEALDQSPLVVSLDGAPCPSTDLIVVMLDALEDAGWKLFPPEGDGA